MEQVFLDTNKGDQRSKKSGADLCKGVFREEKTRIPCQKKANYVCRLSKEDVNGDAGKMEENLSTTVSPGSDPGNAFADFFNL